MTHHTDSSQTTHRQLAKNASTIGFFTALSRIFGFIRDMVIATAFGTSVAAEAFVVSFKIPNLLRDLVGEGATSSAFVPVLTECREKTPQDFWRLVSTLFLMMGFILTVLAVLGVLFAPQIVGLIAPGFLHSQDTEKFPLTVHLTRVIFPYILLIGLSAFAMGALNALKEFGSSAVGPLLLNICMIVAGFFFEKTHGPMALVVGVLAGGVLQFAVQVPALANRGFRWEKPDFRHPSVKKIGRLLLPRALGSAVYQINVFVDSILASFESLVGVGGQSALYYSNRLFQLPLAIFGIALSQALLPTFSTQMIRGDMAAFKNTLSASLRSIAWIVLPAGVGLMVLSRSIVRIIFEHGKFDTYSTLITSKALFFYSIGLLSCCSIKIFVNAFYSMQDTRTPVKTAAVSVVSNILLSFWLMTYWGIGGLTLASSVSATLNVWMLSMGLKKKIGPWPKVFDRGTTIRLILSLAVMGFLAWILDQWWLATLSESDRLPQSLALLAVIVFCAAFYFGCAWLLGVKEVRDAARFIQRTEK